MAPDLLLVFLLVIGASGYHPAPSGQTRLGPLSVKVPKFCSECGSSDIVVMIPDDDERERAVCQACGFTHYENPKIVVGCVVETLDGNFLLGKRSIEPRIGFWDIPKGFMENGETTKECASREILEETGARITPEAMRLVALYNLPNQVQIVYRALVRNSVCTDLPLSTKESSEIRLFPYDDLPDLAFPTTRWAIDYARRHHLANNVVQQWTKAYDPQTGEWTLTKDEDESLEIDEALLS